MRKYIQEGGPNQNPKKGQKQERKKLREAIIWETIAISKKIIPNQYGQESHQSIPWMV
jgi:hypothetical protein